MGYSIFVQFESENAKQQMLVFLNQHFQPLSDIAPAAFAAIQPEDSHIPHDDLAYTGEFNEPYLGYNYGAGDSDLERDYRTAICTWMAVHSGLRPNVFAEVIYDGSDRWLICTEDEYHLCDADLHTDTNGSKTLPTLMLMERALGELNNAEPFVDDLMKTDTAVHNELSRLSTLWRMAPQETE